jgi:hypothetical protein
MLRPLFAAIFLGIAMYLPLANTAHGALIFTEPHIVDAPGNSGQIFLGVSTDTDFGGTGGETLDYIFSGLTFIGVDPDVIVTPLPGMGSLFVPVGPPASTLLLVGNYQIQAGAADFDATTFSFDISFAPQPGLGVSTYNLANNPLLEGSVTAVANPVAEPASVLALGLGIAALGLRRRRETSHTG